MSLKNKRVTLSSVSQDRSLDATSPVGVASPTTKGFCPTHTGVTIQSGVVSNQKGLCPTHTGVTARCGVPSRSLIRMFLFLGLLTVAHGVCTMGCHHKCSMP